MLRFTLPDGCFMAEGVAAKGEDLQNSTSTEPEDKTADSQNKAGASRNWFTTLPGILTASATLITAITGLYLGRPPTSEIWVPHISPLRCGSAFLIGCPLLHRKAWDSVNPHTKMAILLFTGATMRECPLYFPSQLYIHISIISP